MFSSADLKGLGVAVAAIALIIMILASFVTYTVTKSSYKDFIKSKTLLNPTIELHIKDNQVDTLYIYKLPENE